MNNLAFQIYGLKKNVFQSTWDTTITTVGTIEYSNNPAYGTNWTTSINLNTTASTHTVGFTNELVSTRNAVAMQIYQIVCTVTGTTGSIQVKFGNTTSVAIYPGTTTITLMALTTDFLRVIPTSDFDGTVRVSVKDSSSASNQVKLPLPNLGTYNIWVDWGDGTSDNITSYDSIKTLHTYPVGTTTPTIRISGNIFNWNFSSFATGDRAKIKTISSWGKLKLGVGSFQGCSNLTLSGVTDIPDLSTVTSLGATFSNCTLITTIGRIGEWNMTSITSTGGMFSGAFLFNQSLSGWERTGSTLANVTDMSGMFQNAYAFNGNLSGWNLSKVTTFAGMFQQAQAFNNGALAGAGGTMPWTINTTTPVRMDSMFYNHYSFNQDIGSWNVSKVNNFNSFLYHDTSSQANTFNNGGSDSIKNWNVGSCTNFNYMFVRCRFNQPVHLWDVSKAISMDAMFYGCPSFNNGYLSGVANQLPWNTSACTSMSSMFQSCTAFNSNLGTGTTQWDVSKVIAFNNMFNSASNFNNGDETTQSKMNDWNINNVSTVNMSSMFNASSKFNRDISGWNMIKVNNTSGMFATAIVFTNGDNLNTNPITLRSGIDGWDTSNIVSMQSMFNGAFKFNRDISSWNVGKVTTFANMFTSAIVFNNGDNLNINPITGIVGIDGWNINTVSNISMANMFSNASVFNRDVGSWNVTKVTDMQGMFYNAYKFNKNIGPWERVGSTVANVTTLYQFMCGYNGVMDFNNNGSSSINNWNTSSVTSMAQCFMNNLSLNQPLNNWNTSNVTDMSQMFQMWAGNSIFNQDLGYWNVNKVVNFGNMFNNAIAFNNGANTNTNPVTGLQGMDGWNINTVSNVNMVGMFVSALAFNRPIGNWNMTKVINTSQMFQQAINFNQPLSNWERIGSTMGNVTTMENMFYMNYGTANLFNQDISTWNTSKVTSFKYMFTNTAKFNNGLGIGAEGSLPWVTSELTTTYRMFNNAVAFNCDVSTFTMAKVIDMTDMFNYAIKFNNGDNLNINSITGRTGINGWNINTTSNVIAPNLFYYASPFSRALTDWNTIKVTDMSQMFSYTVFNNGLTSGTSGTFLWDTRNCISMGGMFAFNNAFNQIINGWDVSKVQSLGAMFNTNTYNQPLNLWNTSSCTNMGSMFQRNSYFNQDIGMWDVSKVTNMSYMFYNDTPTLSAFNQNIGSWNVSSVTNFTAFMTGKTPSNFSSTNLNAIYNGWGARTTLQHTTPISITFGTAKYSLAGKAGKDALLASPNNWTITDGLLTVSGTSNNGGLIRVTTTAAHGFTTGNSVYIYGVNGTTNANGTWVVTLISTTIIELQGSTYNAAWTSGGNVILG